MRRVLLRFPHALLTVLPMRALSGRLPGVSPVMRDLLAALALAVVSAVVYALMLVVAG